jgi:hypothetical protein
MPVPAYYNSLEFATQRWLFFVLSFLTFEKIALSKLRVQAIRVAASRIDSNVFGQIMIVAFQKH